MTKECPICRGSHRVRMPLYHSVSAFEPTAALEMQEPYREYPCPECKGDSAPFERLHVVAELRDVVTDAMPAINDAVRFGIARALADDMLKRGLIAFEVGKPHSYRMTTPVRGTLCAVAPKNVATMEDRIAERQMQVAGLVVEEAVRQVNNWRSDFYWTSLSKTDAGRLIRESLGLVTKKFAEWRKMEQ